MIWAPLAMLCALGSIALAAPIFVHAFRRSLGTGVMVLCIPGYVLLYAFSQFDAPSRHWVVPALLGALVLTGVFGALAV